MSRVILLVVRYACTSLEVFHGIKGQLVGSSFLGRCAGLRKTGCASKPSI